MYKLVDLGLDLDLRYTQNVEELQRSVKVVVLIRSPDGELKKGESSGGFGPEKAIVQAINCGMGVGNEQAPKYLITDCDYGGGRYFQICVSVGDLDGIRHATGEGEGSDFYIAFAYAYARALDAWKR